MAKPTHKTFAEHLVAQDPPLTEQQYREHRMQLEKALTNASRREFRVRMTVLVLWSLYLILVMVVPALAIGFAKGGQNKFLSAYPLVMYLLLIVTLVETVSYFVRFLPARLRAGSALNRNTLLDLDRRFTELSNRIDQATKENRPEQKP